MTRGFTTNDPAEVPAQVSAGSASMSDFTREALLTQIRMRDEAITDLSAELAKTRTALEDKTAECERWVGYNNRLSGRLERVREALK